MENLKVLRKQHNLSQQKLADILHISQQSVYKYENDITSPDLETLIKMADFFNTSVDYIIGHTEISHKIEPVTDSMLNQDELLLLSSYRQLSPTQQKLIREIAESYQLK